MAAPVSRLPDVLVLGAGGTLGIAWLRGLIAGLEEVSGLELRRCEYFVATSAVAYVAPPRASGHRVGEPVGDPGRTPDVAAEALPGDDGGHGGRLTRLAGGGGRLAAALTAPL